MFRSRVMVWLIACTGGIAALASTPASAQQDRAILQYFEATWNTMRYRMPDVFMAGYNASWLPPVSKGQSGAASIGYDLFDRFDLGTTAAPTRYGTESDFRLLVDAFHRANCEVYVDWIMNHNGTWDHNTPGFIAQGGYPGFVLTGGSGYGDFNAYAGGCPQSTNPGGGCYDLFNGRLLGLIDINQSLNLLFIRHPVAANGQNIPAGTTYNQIDPENARFYSDTDLAPVTVTNPGTSRNPGTFVTTVYPFNTVDPTQGDAVAENATQLLLRSTRWMLEEFAIDGFRLDAAKHVPTWFWDNLWDSAVAERRRAPNGEFVTPYSFVEAVEGNGTMVNWVRKPGELGANQGWPAQGWEFGNRDALDLNEAGQLRDLVDADGVGSWDNVLNASVDNVDGYQNGTIGVHHVNSHDNTIGDSENDTVAQAFALMRTGNAIVYYCALQFGNPPGNFPRANGRDDALGNGGVEMTRLVDIRKNYVRGWYFPINSTDPVNQSAADVLVFTRRTPNSVDNLLVAVNDREDNNNVETRNVATAFPAGTRLHELTGNAADPMVDPNNQIPDVLVVDAQGRLADANNPTNPYLKIPGNRRNNVLHGRGYVIYGPAVPGGVLSVSNVDETIPADSVATPAHARRLTAVDVVRAASFEIQLQTTQSDPLDPNTDDRAVFRIDQGFEDHNGSGGVDHPTGTEAGMENFLTQNSPRFTGGSGLYRQIINTDSLSEGYHYITVWAYRHRDAGDPLFREFRKVIYVDRQPPQTVLSTPTQTGSNDIMSGSFTAVAQVDDADVSAVHIFLNQHVSTDLVALAQGGQGQTTRDGQRFSRPFAGAVTGNHRIGVVVFDMFGNAFVSHFVGINANTPIFGGLGDLNNDFAVNGRDIQPFVNLVTGAVIAVNPAADFSADGLNDLNDLVPFVARLVTP